MRPYGCREEEIGVHGTPYCDQEMAKMAGAFVESGFRKGQLEFRYENGVVCVYGTATGLRSLADFCTSLVEHPNQGHIHVEDYRILTARSEKAAIAIFDTSGEE